MQIVQSSGMLRASLLDGHRFLYSLMAFVLCLVLPSKTMYWNRLLIAEHIFRALFADPDFQIGSYWTNFFTTPEVGSLGGIRPLAGEDFLDLLVFFSCSVRKASLARVLVRQS